MSLPIVTLAYELSGVVPSGQVNASGAQWASLLPHLDERDTLARTIKPSVRRLLYSPSGARYREHTDAEILFSSSGVGDPTRGPAQPFVGRARLTRTELFRVECGPEEQDGVRAWCLLVFFEVDAIQSLRTVGEIPPWMNTGLGRARLLVSALYGTGPHGVSVRGDLFHSSAGSWFPLAPVPPSVDEQRGVTQMLGISAADREPTGTGAPAYVQLCHQVMGDAGLVARPTLGTVRRPYVAVHTADFGAVFEQRDELFKVLTGGDLRLLPNEVCFSRLDLGTRWSVHTSRAGTLTSMQDPDSSEQRDSYREFLKADGALDFRLGIAHSIAWSVLMRGMLNEFERSLSELRASRQPRELLDLHEAWNQFRAQVWWGDITDDPFSLWEVFGRISGAFELEERVHSLASEIDGFALASSQRTQLDLARRADLISRWGAAFAIVAIFATMAPILPDSPRDLPEQLDNGLIEWAAVLGLATLAVVAVMSRRRDQRNHSQRRLGDSDAVRPARTKNRPGPENTRVRSIATELPPAPMPGDSEDVWVTWLVELVSTAWASDINGTVGVRASGDLPYLHLSSLGQLILAAGAELPGRAGGVGGRPKEWLVRALDGSDWCLVDDPEQKHGAVVTLRRVARELDLQPLVRHEAPVELHDTAGLREYLVRYANARLPRQPLRPIADAIAASPYRGSFEGLVIGVANELGIPQDAVVGRSTSVSQWLGMLVRVEVIAVEGVVDPSQIVNVVPLLAPEVVVAVRSGRTADQIIDGVCDWVVAQVEESGRRVARPVVLEALEGTEPFGVTPAHVVGGGPT